LKITKKAIEVGEKALELTKKVFGPRHLITSSIILRLGSLFWVKGDEENAKRYLVECIDIRRELFGPDHKEVKEAEHLLDEVNHKEVFVPPPPPPPKAFFPPPPPQLLQRSMNAPPPPQDRREEQRGIPLPPPNAPGGIPLPPPPPMSKPGFSSNNQRNMDRMQQVTEQVEQCSLKSEMQNFERGKLKKNKKQKEYDANAMAKKMQGFNKRRINLKSMW